MRIRDHEKGFTLVEVLIALSILSLVMIVLTSTFDFAQRSFATMSDAEDQFVDVAMTRRLFVDALSQVDTAAGRALTLLFSGTPTDFAVSVLGPRILSASNPMLLEAKSSPDGGLVLSWQNPTSDYDRPAIVRRTVAADFLVRFSYFAARVGWISDWTDRASEPSLLKVTFSQRKNQAAAIDLMIPIQRITPALCAVRPAASGCPNE